MTYVPWYLPNNAHVYCAAVGSQCFPTQWWWVNMYYIHMYW